MDFIFRAGVSTAQQVTAISGRGIGIDVVQSTVARLRGAIDIQTILGKGTRFTLDLPLTLAATLAVIIRSGGEVAAVPHKSVEYIVRLRAKDLGTVAGRASVRVDDAQVPFFSWARCLGSAWTRRLSAQRCETSSDSTPSRSRPLPCQSALAA